MTPAAEAIVSSGHALQIKGGRLSAANETQGRALLAAIWAAANSTQLSERAPRTVIVHSMDSTPLVFDVVRLPMHVSELSLQPQILVVSHRGNGAQARQRLLLQSVYKLTDAETEVALQVAHGQTAESIAAARGVVVGTVRAQIKRLLAKLGVKRQVELVARLSQL